jgi:hypothetical protein
MAVRRGEETNCGKFLFVANDKPTIVLLVYEYFTSNLTVRKMAGAGVPPNLAEIINPAPPHPVEIVTDSQPGAEDDNDDKILFPNWYGDIDERAVGTDDEMPEADNTTMQVNSHHADKCDNLSHENLSYEILLLLFHSVVCSYLGSGHRRRSC